MRPIPLDLGVAAIVLRDSKILLVQEAQGPHEGQWGLPKGYVNPGELPASAVIRELHEECGIKGTVTGICGVRECVRNELARIFIAYHVQTSNQPLAIDVDEISEARFASADELEQFNWISPAMHELAKSGLLNDSPLAKIDFSKTQSYPYLVHIAKEGIPI
tara:strand:+ start:65 stop:550 length:486 start_codon:yes stop_codon:yes gene_type:complete